MGRKRDIEVSARESGYFTPRRSLYNGASEMTERNDRYEEDNYYRREERDDPNEMDRDESLNDCLLEIARLVNELKSLVKRQGE